MKIKPGYILKKVMGSYMLVSTAGEVNTMQTMNETGAFLFALLQEGMTVDAMAEKMVSEYEVDSATAKKDIEKFVSQLKQAGLLDE
ncbi:MAG: PqqD family protein [Clostridia bacterium]|nr:PqqD family protein [Clostridia bacterium]